MLLGWVCVSLGCSRGLCSPLVARICGSCPHAYAHGPSFGLAWLSCVLPKQSPHMLGAPGLPLPGGRLPSLSWARLGASAETAYAHGLFLRVPIRVVGITATQHRGFDAAVFASASFGAGDVHCSPSCRSSQSRAIDGTLCVFPHVPHWWAFMLRPPGMSEAPVV